MRKLLWLAACCIALGTSVSEAAPAYIQVQTVDLGAPSRWDYAYADAASHRIFVSHGTEATVIDEKSLSVAGKVTGLNGAHGILIVGKYGYASSGKSGTVTVFDRTTLKSVDTLNAKPDADGMAYDPATNNIYVVDGDSGSVTVIDTKSAKVVATIDVGGSLEFPGADGRGHLFVNEVEPGHIVRIDTHTNKVLGRWDVPGCKGPTGLAVDAAHHRIFTSCNNAVMLAMDSDNGHVAATLPIGQGTDAAAFDQQRQLVFSSNRDGTLSVFHETSPDRFEMLDTVMTAPGARTLTINQASGRVYLPAGGPKGTVRLLVLTPAR